MELERERQNQDQNFNVMNIQAIKHRSLGNEKIAQ